MVIRARSSTSSLFLLLGEVPLNIFLKNLDVVKVPAKGMACNGKVTPNGGPGGGPGGVFVKRGHDVVDGVGTVIGDRSRHGVLLVRIGPPGDAPRGRA